MTAETGSGPVSCLVRSVLFPADDTAEAYWFWCLQSPHRVCDGPSQAEDDSAALKHEPPLEFSGEEALGRYLDLHGHHMAFVNSPFGRQQDYAEYVATLDAFDLIPRRHRTGAAYQCA